MATTDIGIQHGATIAYESTPGSGIFNTELNEVRAIGLPELSRAVHDKTHLQSPNTHREKYAGLKDTGPFTVTVLFTESNYADILTAYALGETGWQITTAQSSTYEVDAFISSVGGVELNDDGEQVVTITLTPTAQGTFTESPA